MNFPKTQAKTLEMSQDREVSSYYDGLSRS